MTAEWFRVGFGGAFTPQKREMQYHTPILGYNIGFPIGKTTEIPIEKNTP